jgi:hypothetical protein
MDIRWLLRICFLFAPTSKGLVDCLSQSQTRSGARELDMQDCLRYFRYNGQNSDCICNCIGRKLIWTRRVDTSCLLYVFHNYCDCKLSPDYKLWVNICFILRKLSVLQGCDRYGCRAGIRTAHIRDSLVWCFSFHRCLLSQDAPKEPTSSWCKC